MENTKPFYRSTGVLAGLAVVVASVMGMDIRELDFNELVDNLDNIVLAVFGLLGAYGRLRATSVITLGSPEPAPTPTTPATPPVPPVQEPTPKPAMTPEPVTPASPDFTPEQVEFLKSLARRP